MEQKYLYFKLSGSHNSGLVLILALLLLIPGNGVAQQLSFDDGWIPGPSPYLSPDGLSITSLARHVPVKIEFDGEGIDLYYLYGPERDSFTVTIDEELKAGQKIRGSARKTDRLSFGNLGKDKHIMDISVKSGVITLHGVNAWYAHTYNKKGASVHKWGNTWASTEEFAEIDSVVFSSALKELDPYIVVIMLGTNDHNLDHRDPVSVRNNLTLIIRRIQAALPSAKIMLLSTVDKDKSEEQGLLPLNLAIAYPEAAQKCGVEYWDMNELFGTCTTEKLPDGVHVSGKWSRLLAERLLKRLMN